MFKYLIAYIVCQLLIFYIMVIFSDHSTLRHCRMYEDTFGEWVVNPTKEPHVNEDKKKELLKHFVGGSPVEALWFHKVWVPTKCSYHRFTSKSAENCVYHMIDNNHIRNSSSNNSVNILFIGDSSVRGIVCGITRILSGSEVYGPCINPICGGNKNWTEPVGYKKLGVPVTAGNIF